MLQVMNIALHYNWNIVMKYNIPCKTSSFNIKIIQLLATLPLQHSTSWNTLIPIVVLLCFL